MHFGLTISPTTFTTNINVVHHYGYRIASSASSSSIKTTTIRAAALNDYNRRICVGLRHNYLSHNNDTHGRHHICHAKGEKLHDDDQPQPIVITSLPPPPDDDEDQSPQLLQFGDSAILSACFVGLFTGVAVVLFNYTVHEIRDLCWDGIPDRGASWLREEPIEAKWGRVILVPAFGGLVVSLLNMIRTAIDDSTDGSFMSSIKSALKPILKTVAACVTLGTGNSLGPEGPSVEIGVSVSKGVATFLDKGAQKKLSLRAAGSAAGISSGF